MLIVYSSMMITEAKNIVNSVDFSLEEGLPDDVFYKIADIINALNETDVFNKAYAIKSGDNSTSDTGAEMPKTPNQGELVSGAEQGAEAVDKERESVKKLAEQLKDLFALMKNSNVEIQANIGEGQVLGKTSSLMSKMVTFKDINSEKLNEISNNQYRFVHNHPSGREPAFAASNDFMPLEDYWDLGTRVNMLYSNGLVSIMDFTKATKEQFQQFLDESRQKFDEYEKSIQGNEQISANEISQEHNRIYREVLDKLGLNDVFKIFKEDQVAEIAEYLSEAEKRLDSISGFGPAFNSLGDKLLALRSIINKNGKSVSRDDETINGILQNFENGSLTSIQAFDKIEASQGSSFRLGNKEEFDKMQTILLDKFKIVLPEDEIKKVKQEIYDKALTSIEALETIKDKLGIDISGINPNDFDLYRSVEEMVKSEAELRAKVHEMNKKNNTDISYKDYDKYAGRLKSKYSSVDAVFGKIQESPQLYSTQQDPSQSELVSGAEQGTEAVDRERESVEKLAEQLKYLFDLMKKSKVEISSNFGDDQVLGMVTSMQSHKLNPEDNNVGRMQTIGNHQYGHIHNHPSGNPNFTPGNDFNHLLNGWDLGQRVNALYYNEKSYDEDLGK